MPTSSFAERERARHPERRHQPAGHTPDPSFARSFADREIARNGHLVHRLKAKDSTGRWAFYFVYVMPARERAFLDAMKSGRMVNLEDYGRVIASCYGEEPNEATCDLMWEKYGFRV